MTRATFKKKSVRLPAFAKINLCLHVVGKRPDGYHELRTIFQAISLRDTLELSLTPDSSGFHFTLTSNDEKLLGAENLVARAVSAMQQELGFHGDVAAHLEKKIPVARGMGGGSSDAAAAMIGMLRLMGKKVPLARLLEIASGLGADVPFFLFGGRALAVNRGDEIYPLPNAPQQMIVVVSPRDIAVSTKDAFQWISAQLTKRPDRKSVV
jgi:4-diphosphocytidyl-2-C-methyl-D-erythritol kinase